MSAVAVTSQPSQPASSSLNTPGFFTQAFLELNVFEQCFSSLQAESTPSASTSDSTSDSTSISSIPDQKMNNSIDSLNPPSPRSIGCQNSGNEYSTPLGPALSLPSPIMHERRFHSTQNQHPNNIIPSSIYQPVDRRYSLQERPPFENTSMQSQSSLASYHANRRFSHQQPLTSSYSASPGASAWAGNIMEGTSFDSNQRQSTASPRLQQFYLTNPTPPNSTHSNSPVDKFSIDGPPQSQLSPVENLSPLDTMIIDDRNNIGQTTPPAENSALFDGSESGGGSDFQVLPQPSSQLPALSELSKNNSRNKRGSTRGGSSNTRKSKKNNVAPPPAELETDVHDAKRKRFLERNRVAASKCRQKKKMWMQELEHNARTVQNNAKGLNAIVSCLREEVLQLKGMLLKHSGCGCSQIATYLLNEAAKVANGAKQSMESMENSKTISNQVAASFQPNNSQADPSQGSRLHYSSSTNEDENPFDDDDSMLGDGMADFENELELRDPGRSP